MPSTLCIYFVNGMCSYCVKAHYYFPGFFFALIFVPVSSSYVLQFSQIRSYFSMPLAASSCEKKRGVIWLWTLRSWQYMILTDKNSTTHCLLAIHAKLVSTIRSWWSFTTFKAHCDGLSCLTWGVLKGELKTMFPKSDYWGRKTRPFLKSGILVCG